MVVNLSDSEVSDRLQP